MSGKEGGSDVSNNGKGNNGISGVIPSESKKMIQSLKEVVNFSEAEIYATLKDCDMDPNDAVNRLLSLDPFREVKSKKEKKKENKDATDTRFRGASSTSHCGSKGGIADRHGCGGPTQFSSYDSAALHNKQAYRKENGVHAYAGSSSSASADSNVRWPPSLSQPVTINNNGFTTSTVDTVSSSSQPPTGFPSAWLGAQGQVSMADIVKMGKPQDKDSAMSHNQGSDNRHAATSPSTASHHDLHSSEGWNFQEIKLESDADVSMHADGNDEWEYIEYPPDAGVSSPDSHLYTAPSSLPYNRINQHLESEVDNIPSTEDLDAEALTRSQVVPTSVAGRNMQDGSRSSSLFDNNFHEKVDSYHSRNDAFEHNEAKDDGSSVAANLKQLSLHNDDQDQDASDEEDDCSVIIPDHLQVHALECPHLSFGSFRSGITSGVSGSFASRPLENNLEEISEAVDASFLGNRECYVDEHLRNVDDENILRRTGVNAETYDSSSVSQSGVVKDEAPVVPQGNQFSIPSLEQGYAYSNSQQVDTMYTSQQTRAQIRHVSPLSSLLAYTDSLPSTMLDSDVHTGREPRLFDSPISMTQPMPAKYGVTATSVDGPSISISEALRLSNINQATPQTLSAVNVANRPSQPHQPAVHRYSQPNLPFANSIRYPFLPQNYPYLPSSFQQNFSNNNTYPQSLATMLPHYRNSASLNSLPQSAAGLASGYSLGTTNNIATGSFPLNLPTASAGTNLGYGDDLGSQYKGSNHLSSLQQNENSGMWVNGLGSRNMSALPANSYYNLQSQQQQHQGGYRQGQQPVQHFGGNGYPNYYSQTGMLPEHQIQPANTREVSRSGLLGQGQLPNQNQNQNQKLWQNSY